ncbi:uncharacterized protein LOC115768258 [Drosophila novamexicana]|uniref:uncharacterized protein LOC115768258 n=1 Tax=Drosophila novamexicana TaxID=47314 RepID=UPI0011E597A2|nr:uncharacterized protein LOC115768258 [Drosophila novamexicana]
MKMNRTRFNHMRHERENDGLPQVLQVPLSVSPQMGNALNALRKTTFTRTELMQRPPMATGTNRSKRLTNLNTVNRPLSNGTTASAEVNANRRMGGTRGHFLPRVAKLAGNNNSNVNNNGSNFNSSNMPKSLLTRSKSPFKKKPKSSHHLTGGCDHSVEKSAKPQQHQLYQQKHKQLELELELEQEQEHPLELSSIVTGNGIVKNCNSSNSSSSSSSLMSSCCLSNSSSELRKIKLAKAFRLPDEQNKSFVYLCKPVKKVKELLMVRPLRNSVDNVDQQQLQVADDGTDENLDVELADSDSFSCCSSTHQLEAAGGNQCELETQLLDVRQRQQQLLLLTERALRPQAISDQELERERERERDRQQEQQRQLHLVQNSQAEKQRKLEMEMVWQNIPTLQREIKLLQQLGEKLEATLRANNPTTTPRQGITSYESNSIFYTPRSTLTLNGYEALPIVYFGCRRVEHLAAMWQCARINYHARCFGCVREYRIETKTLTELKTADEMQCFYMPLAEGGGLQRTSFRMLRENPNVLLQQLRPLTPARPFNLLEQDAMFFHSMVSYGEPQLGGCQMAPVIDKLVPARETGGGNSQLPFGQLPFSLTPYTRLSVRSPGLKEAINWSSADVERLLLPAVKCEPANSLKLKQKSEPEPRASSSHSSLGNVASIKCANLSRWKRPKPKPMQTMLAKRSTHPRRVAPLKSNGTELEPRVQTQLLKTVLVGIVQVAVFLVLIMAFTYPDIRC